MTLKELFLGNIQSGQAATIMSMGSNSESKADSVGNSSFKNVFEQKINSPNRNQSYNKIQSYDATEKSAETVTEKQNYKTYFEAQRAQLSKKSSSTKASGSTQNDNADKVDGENEAISKEPTNAVNIIAQLMGVNVNELQRLLDEAGVELDSTGSIESIYENASKLSQLLGLDENQEKVLAELLQMAKEILEPMKDIQPQNAKPQLAAQGEAAIVTTNGQAQGEDVLDTLKLDELTQKLNMKITSKLEEFSEGLANDSQAVVQELKEALKPLQSNASIKAQQLSQQTVEGGSMETTEEALLTTESSQEKASQESDSESKSDSGYKGGHEADTAVLGSKNSYTQAAFAMVQPEKTFEATAAQILSEKAVPVTPTEIINQVIEKASVLMTSEKSEMTMELKPDSLGRISLKIATENGIITAKFIAESQQVKQVLESNMELLKNSLERQGMNVEGFSVSVRQDSQQQDRQFNLRQEVNGSKRVGTSFRTAGIEGNTGAVFGVASDKNPYQWESSTINLTA